MAGSICVRGVLIDMDGTAVDSNAIVEESWAHVCEEFGLNLPELLAFSHGRPGNETYRKFVPRMSEAEISRRVRAMLDNEQKLAHLAKPIAGANRFLAELEELSVPWALVTSAPRTLAQARFEAAALPWPRSAIAVEDVTVGKPSPQGYRLAAAALGVDPAEAVVLEDAPAGVRAGLRSGAQVILVDPTGPFDSGRLEEDVGLSTRIAAQVPNLESLHIRSTEEPEVFRLSW